MGIITHSPLQLKLENRKECHEFYLKPCRKYKCTLEQKTDPKFNKHTENYEAKLKLL